MYIYHITGATPGEAKSCLLAITLDKDVYQQGERMSITIENLSNETLTFSNLAYGLGYHSWNGFSWIPFRGIPGKEAIGKLKPGEIGHVQHSLVGIWCLPVGKCRVGNSYYNCWAEFSVISR